MNETKIRLMGQRIKYGQSYKTPYDRKFWLQEIWLQYDSVRFANFDLNITCSKLYYPVSPWSWIFKALGTGLLSPQDLFSSKSFGAKSVTDWWWWYASKLIFGTFNGETWNLFSVTLRPHRYSIGLPVWPNVRKKLPNLPQNLPNLPQNLPNLPQNLPNLPENLPLK